MVCHAVLGRDFGGQREAIDPDSETTASRLVKISLHGIFGITQHPLNCTQNSFGLFREFAEETMGLFGDCGVNGSSVAACSRQMHTQLTQRQHVLKVVHQLKKVLPQLTCLDAIIDQSASC